NAYATDPLGLTSAAEISACETCVTTKGYWLNPRAADKDITPNAAVFAGSYLWFYPDKYDLLALAYERLANTGTLLALRDAVIGNDPGGHGTYLIQKMLPQSCTGSGRPSHQIGAINDTGLSYFGTYDPLAEMLLNMAWYQLDQISPYGISGYA